MIQRLAALSYCTIGSPSLLVWQPPPKPAQSVLPVIGPASLAPVALSNTANDSFTHCTYCVAPTAPLVSGGAASGANPRSPAPTPAKLSTPVTEALAPGAVCAIGSSTSGPVR